MKLLLHLRIIPPPKKMKKNTKTSFIFKCSFTPPPSPPLDPASALPRLPEEMLADVTSPPPRPHHDFYAVPQQLVVPGRSGCRCCCCWCCCCCCFFLFVSCCLLVYLCPALWSSQSGQVHSCSRLRTSSHLRVGRLAVDVVTVVVVVVVVFCWLLRWWG